MQRSYIPLDEIRRFGGNSKNSHLISFEGIRRDHRISIALLTKWPRFITSRSSTEPVTPQNRYRMRMSKSNPAFILTIGSTALPNVIPCSDFGFYNPQLAVPVYTYKEIGKPSPRKLHLDMFQFRRVWFTRIVRPDNLTIIVPKYLRDFKAALLFVAKNVSHERDQKEQEVRRDYISFFMAEVFFFQYILVDFRPWFIHILL